MNIRFKVTRALLAAVRQDLARPHPFAAERVGFISAGFAQSTEHLLALARDYRPVTDDDYLPDRRVGAMIGPAAIRKAMQWALTDQIGVFHVHAHAGRGTPAFSPVDLAEQVKFMPSFLNVAAKRPHGAIVLSEDGACGRVWISRTAPPQYIGTFIEVGAPLRKWSGP